MILFVILFVDLIVHIVEIPNIFTFLHRRVFFFYLFSFQESLPRTATLRKLNDLIKRARLAKVNLEKSYSFIQISTRRMMTYFRYKH